MYVCMCLVQAVKFEPYHDSALVRFLLKRALRVSRTNICVCFYTVLVCVRACVFLWILYLIPFICFVCVFLLCLCHLD